MKQTNKSMKELEIITDLNTIKVLFNKIRSEIVFKYLVNEAMTVKQLADALGKNPGNILRHIERLKSVGIVRQVKTAKTTTGIVQRYYRATAKEYRLGIADMIKSGDGVRDHAEDRLRSMLSSLAVYGVEIPDSEIQRGMDILKKLIDRENEVSSSITISDSDSWNTLPKEQQNDASRLMREAALTRDEEYQKRRKGWSEFVQEFMR